jgi:hypothetical protein
MNDVASQLKTKNFTWHGPVQGIELKDGGKVILATNLVPGKSYPMPDHKLVDSWKASGLVTPAKPVSQKPQVKKGA